MNVEGVSNSSSFFPEQANLRHLGCCCASTQPGTVAEGSFDNLGIEEFSQNLLGSLLTNLKESLTQFVSGIIDRVFQSISSVFGRNGSALESPLQAKNALTSFPARPSTPQGLFGGSLLNGFS